MLEPYYRHPHHRHSVVALASVSASVLVYESVCKSAWASAEAWASVYVSATVSQLVAPFAVWEKLLVSKQL